MELTETQYARIEPCLPRQRGNVSMPNLQVLNAILYVAEQGCKWRGLPKRFGNWHTIYTRMNRWSKNGVLDRVFEHLQCAQLIPYQAGGGVAGQHRRQGPSRRHGGSKKNGPQAIGKSRGGWTTKIHLVAADARTALTFALSPGQAHDSPEGRKLLASMGPQDDNVALVMDRAYQGDETRQLALDLGFTPVVPPLKTRTDPWEYDREMYKRRNEVERLFRRLKGYRRIFSRFEKLDVMFIGFIHFVLIFDALR